MIVAASVAVLALVVYFAWLRPSLKRIKRVLLLVDEAQGFSKYGISEAAINSAVSILVSCPAKKVLLWDMIPSGDKIHFRQMSPIGNFLVKVGEQDITLATFSGGKVGVKLVTVYDVIRLISKQPTVKRA